MSEYIVEKMNQASLAESHVELKARIEELEVKLKTSEEIGRAFEEDAGQLRAKLAKAVEALASWKHYDESNEVDHVSLMLNYADAIEKTRTTLAELTGGKDE